jgi:ubiquinone/menaquinone biosynthesis C-methylase UbiE
MHHDDGDQLEFSQWKAQRIKDALPEYNKEGLRILDVGCGSATTTYYLQEVFYQAVVTGIDKDHALLADARRHYADLDLQHYDGTTLPYTSQTFDLIVLSFVVHHLTNQDLLRVASECSRVLKPSGAIVVLDINPLNVVARYKFLRDPAERGSLLRTGRAVKRFFSDLHTIKTLYYYSVCIFVMENIMPFLAFGGTYALIMKKN